LRVVFFGTPEFALPTLDALARENEIVLVVAQPDKRAGRGLRLQVPPVAQRAKELGLPLAQPGRVREVVEEVARSRPDAGVVVAYGKILPPALLEIPKHGFLNVHASLLPKYRGAAPIQRAIERGEQQTGITIMRVDEELDHGPILSAAPTGIGADEHAPSLALRLSRLGAGELLNVLRHDRRAAPQEHSQATYAPKIEKNEGEIRWSEPAAAIYNRFRAFDPWPGVFNGDLKFVDLRPASGAGDAGTILRVGEGVVVAALDGAIELLTVQRAGKSAVSATEFARGAGWRPGMRVA
jgi:methionyl-tRNA formyltransferase